jgi:hypothetical protein
MKGPRQSGALCNFGKLTMNSVHGTCENVFQTAIGDGRAIDRACSMFYVLLRQEADSAVGTVGVLRRRGRPSPPNCHLRWAKPGANRGAKRSVSTGPRIDVTSTRTRTTLSMRSSSRRWPPALRVSCATSVAASVAPPAVTSATRPSVARHGCSRTHDPRPTQQSICRRAGRR